MSGEAKPLVMVLNGACWPGNDASGPNRSLRALAAALNDDIRFHLVARDRAFGATHPEPCETSDPDFARCTYLAPGHSAAKALVGIVERAEPDLIWLNGFHDREFTLPVLLAKRRGHLRDVPVLLSPRGEFAAGALRLKRMRKVAYRLVARLLRLLDGVVMHATGESEAADIRAALPWLEMHASAPNVAALPTWRPRPATTSGKPLQIVFLGRITPVKNLGFALRALSSVRSPVCFHIVGPAQDRRYWDECRALMRCLPPHVETRVHGALARTAVLDRFGEADLLFLPSRAENFSHAIFEALGSGVPALISDQTPWRGLEDARAGFDLPLGHPETFAAAVDRFAALADREAWQRGARLIAEAHLVRSDAAASNAAMLFKLMRAAA